MNSQAAGFANAEVVSRFDPSGLPSGRITRLLVRISSNAMGRAVEIPMMVAKGMRPGPTFGITAVVHGNEVNGIPVIHRLFERIDTRRLRGVIAAVPVVNIPGLVNNQRTFSDGTDLNDIMPGRSNGNEPQLYSARFIERVVQQFDLLLDLHTASFGRVNSLYVRANMSNQITARMAILQRPQIILHNPPSDTTLRGVAEGLGIPAVTVEIGDPQQFQPEFIRRALSGIRAVLMENNMIPKRKLIARPHPIICSESRWLYTDHGGLLEVIARRTEIIKEGQIIARLTNVFGDLLHEYRAPDSGIVIGKSTNPVGQAGARILHLGKMATPQEINELAEHLRTDHSL